MTDLEMTKKCAEAIGLTEETQRILESGWNGTRYDPLHDDAQAMALVKRFDLSISRGGHATNDPWWFVSSSHPTKKSCRRSDLNRAIVECVASMK